MAYTFASASSQYLRTNTGSPVSVLPLTISCWVYPTANSGTTTRAAVVIHHATDTSRVTLVGIGANAYAACVASGGANSGATLTNAYTTNTWLHMAAVHTSNASRTVWCNGTSATDTTSVASAPSTLQRVTIGSNHAGGSGMEGRIGEVGIWSVALTNDEIISLSRGVSPALVRPQSLAFYAPLIRELVEIRNSLAITNTNSATVGDHPRIHA